MHAVQLSQTYHQLKKNKHRILKIACGKLMIYYWIIMKILSTVQSLLFSMDKCILRGFFIKKCFDVLLQLFQNLQLLMVSLGLSWALTAGLQVWEQNPISVYCPVQMNAELNWNPALGPAGAALDCRGYGRSRCIRSTPSIVQNNVTKEKSQVTYGNHKVCLNFHITKHLGHAPLKGLWTDCCWLQAAAGGWVLCAVEPCAACSGAVCCTCLKPEDTVTPSLLL